MPRFLASDSEREANRPMSTEWIIKEALQGQGSCVRLTRSGRRRLERRDIKAEIDAYLFCLIEDTVPTIHNILWRFAISNIRYHQPVPNHHIKTRPALHPKNPFLQSSISPQIIKSTSLRSSLRLPLLPFRAYP